MQKYHYSMNDENSTIQLVTEENSTIRQGNNEKRENPGRSILLLVQSNPRDGKPYSENTKTVCI